MKKKEDNPAFDCHSSVDVEHGVRVQAKASIYLDKACYPNSMQEWFSSDLDAEIEKSKSAEDKILQGLDFIFGEWANAAAKTRLLEKVQEYKNTPSALHTNNQWIPQQKSWGTVETISNATYKMTIRVYSGFWQKNPYWEVTWLLTTNSPSACNTTIAGQDNKKFGSEEGAQKYIVGRIKAYASHFTEIYPPVPLEFASCFKVNGLLLPGYTVAFKEGLVSGK